MDRIEVPAFIEVEEGAYLPVAEVVQDADLRAAALVLAKRRSEYDRDVIRVLSNPAIWPKITR